MCLYVFVCLCVTATTTGCGDLFRTRGGGGVFKGVS